MCHFLNELLGSRKSQRAVGMTLEGGLGCFFFYTSTAMVDLFISHQMLTLGER